MYSPDGSISMRLCLEEDGSLTYGAFGYEERFSVWSEMGIKGIKADFFDGE